MKKRMALVLAALMLALAVPALATNLDADDAPSRQVWFYNEGGHQVTPDAYIVQKIREDLNIEFVHSAPQGTDYEERLMVLLASGEIPDVIVTYDTLTTKLLADNLIIPVEEYLNETYLPNLIRITRDFDMVVEKSVRSDGHVYTIPSVNSNPLSTHPWIRMDWLEKVGMDVPTTMDELAEVLIAFANHEDLNGDGATIYATMANEFWGLGDGFLAPFAASWEWYWGEDGLPELGILSPRVKEALAYVKNLMDSGAMNRDIVTMNYTQITEKINAGTVGYLFGWNGNGALYAMQEIYPDAVWKPIEPPTGLYDKGYLNYKDGNNVREEYTITTACTDVEAVLRVMDYMCVDTSDENGMTYEGSYWYYMGERGVHWDLINGAIETGGGDSGDLDAAKKYREQNEIDRWTGSPSRRFQNQFDVRWMGFDPYNIETMQFLLSLPRGTDIPNDDPLKAITLPLVEDEVINNFFEEWCYVKFGEMLCYNAVLGKGEIDELYDQFLEAANKAGYQDVRERLGAILKGE